MGDTILIKKNRGRPVGFRLSEESKDKIRKGRLGASHSLDTKNKISKSLAERFRVRSSLSEALTEEYIDFGDEISAWFMENSEYLDEYNGLIVTERKLASITTLEMCVGNDIEQLFGHNTTPEFLMLLKEELKLNGNAEALAELNSLV